MWRLVLGCSIVVWGSQVLHEGNKANRWNVTPEESEESEEYNDKGGCSTVWGQSVLIECVAGMGRSENTRTGLTTIQYCTIGTAYGTNGTVPLGGRDKRGSVRVTSEV